MLSKWASISSLGIKEEMKSRACIVEVSFEIKLESLPNIEYIIKSDCISSPFPAVKLLRSF